MATFDERNPVLAGAIDYGRVFITFLEHTDQKIAHGLIFEAQLRALKEQGVVLQEGRPTTLVDLGCGEGHTACEMIDAINRVQPEGGVNYYGFDADARFVSSTEQLLKEARQSKQLRTIDVRQADLLSGEALPFPSIDRVLATMGHLLYYAHSAKGRSETRKKIAAVLENIMNLLGQDGLCLLVHNYERCPLATLRASVADSVEPRPARIVAEIAAERRLDVVSFIAPFKIHFPRLVPRQWEGCKDPSAYRLPRNRSDPQFIAMLELLSFIAQRDLKGLAREGKLGRFVDDLRNRIDADGVFAGFSDYQLMLSRRHSPEMRRDVRASVHSIENSLDRIGREAARAFDRRAAQAQGKGRLGRE